MACPCPNGRRRVWRATEDETVKAAYGENTGQALAAGVFGAPSYVLDDELYWGRDRLDFLDRVPGDS